MMSTEEIEEVNRIEEELLKRMTAKIKLRGFRLRREERKAMLEHLACEEKEGNEPTLEEVDKFIEAENNRAKEISDALLLTMQKTFHNVSTLLDEKGQPMHEVTTTVSIRNLKVFIEKPKPININVTCMGHESWTDVKVVNEEDIIRSPIKGREVNAQADKKKPRVILNVRIKSPLTSIIDVIDKNAKSQSVNQTNSENKKCAVEQTNDETVTELDNEKVPLKQRLEKRKRFRDDSDDSDSDLSSKKLNRSLRSRQSPLRGGMQPEAASLSPVPGLMKRILVPLDCPDDSEEA
ncbi:hypothetical protein RF55_15309 [Lasius niger]|uniref:Uncharacterized protein n=1 Tax=Lasius niger TaxID=67767 RepID=A0A0J7K5V6_LASNI|nr:hypothetical protein RF55_15309 [Lasius niger]